MFKRACLGFLLLACPCLWSQVDTSGTEAAPHFGDQVPMQTPPPVSGQDYSTAFASEDQSNILRAGLTLSTAYSSNVVGSENPVSDVTYSVWPTLALDATTTRIHWVLHYSPGFTLYQRMSALNQGNQNVAVDFQYRLSPHLTASVRESFQAITNPLNQPNPLSFTSVSGSAPAANIPVIAPVADQLTNAASAQLSYQFSADGMVGIGGSFNSLRYPNPAEAPGLFNSTSSGGSAFYSRRLFTKYYLGISYQYQDVLASQAGALGKAQTRTQTQVVFVFCTVYLKPTLSLSFSAGPQHYNATQASQPPSQSWSPLAMVSLGWQGERTSLAASYSRVVTGGGGLTGAYHSNMGSASGSWQLNRTWNVGLSASYSLYTTLTPFFVGSSSGGHTVSVTASAQRPLGEHLSMQAGYTRLQQAYGGIAGLSAIPDTNREFISLSYQFARPLKR